MLALPSPPPPPEIVEPRLTLGGGLGWPEVVAVDGSYRLESRVAAGAWFGLSGPLAALNATPMGYFRYFLEGGRNAPFIQFGAGSRLQGLFGGAFSASPLIMASYGYEWRLPNGFTGSADIGGVFDFALAGASPVLRVGIRGGWSPF